VPSVGEDQLVSGVISCSLLAKTPVIVPAAKVEEGDLHDATLPVAPFFRIEGKPVIPGSSIRGPVRSVFETLTSSCMRTNNERLRSAGGRKYPGILEWDEGQGSFVFYEADRYRVCRRTDWVRGDGTAWKTGEIAHITYDDDNAGRFAETSGRVVDIRDTEFRGSKPGYYLRVNTFPGRDEEHENKPSVFVKMEDCAPVVVNNVYLDCLKENIDDYVEHNQNAEHPEIAQEYSEALARLLRHEGALPVWYGDEVEGSYRVFQFAQAQLSRSVYPQTTTDFTKRLGLGQCTSIGQPGGLCPACSLFGFVDTVSGKSPAEARASRVRFTDALPCGEVRTVTVELPALLGPRTSAFEFYLRNDMRGHERSFTPETAGTQLAGRKAYWHSQSGIIGPNINNLTNFESRAEAVSAGSAFRFQVYLDGVTKDHLNSLVYALSFGQAWDEGRASNNDYCHKIGHGKPVGAGSVCIEVEDVLIRTVTDGNYAVAPWDAWKMDRLDIERLLSNVAAVKNVARFTAIPANTTISYPRMAHNDDIFAWFGSNRDRTDTSSVVRYEQVLPHVDRPRVNGGNQSLRP
ncbi:MAG: hypothetical protein IKE22_07010, partial [Atopobiaceae bacterium]|nr:hypothetical protein [Atopobiaceae bacterium]